MALEKNRVAAAISRRLLRRHHLNQVSGAELEGEIPSHAEHDDFLVKVPTFEELLCRSGFRHRWPLTPHSQLFKFAPEPEAVGLRSGFG